MARPWYSSRALDPIAGVVLFGAGALFISLGNYSDYGPDLPIWLRQAPLAAVCLAVALRRTVPIAALCLGTPALCLDFWFGVTLPVVVIYTDNLYSAVLYGPRRAVRLVPVLGFVLAVVLIVVLALVGGGFAEIVIAFSVWVGVVASPVLTAVVVRQARERARLESARAEQEVRLGELRRQEAVLTERTRMARELHDSVANYLSAIALQSTGLQTHRDLDRDTVERSVAAIRRSSLEGLAELRRIIGLLRTGDADEDLVSYRLDQVRDLVERMRGFGLEVEFEAETPQGALPGEIETAAYRVVQEALTNALKYGSEAAVRIACTPGAVTVEVENTVSDGSARLAPGGAGLVGLAERVRLLGGDVEAGPVGRLWRVRAELPLEGNR